MKHWTVAVLGAVLALAFGVQMASAAEAKEPAGKTLFLSYKCNSCHTVKAVGIEKKAAEPTAGEKAAPPTSTSTSTKKPSDLSSLGLDYKADWITKYMKKLEPAKDGKKHVKTFKGTDEELATLSAWLETMKAKKTEPAGGKDGAK